MRVKEFCPAKKSQIIEKNDFGFQGKDKCGLHQCVFSIIEMTLGFEKRTYVDFTNVMHGRKDLARTMDLQLEAASKTNL